MKLKIFVLIVLIVSGWNCKKNDSGTGPIDPPSNNPDYISIENSRLSAALSTVSQIVFVSGIVTDEEGKPLSGVSVAAGDSTVTTDSKGEFKFHKAIELNRNYAVISATLSGYLKAIKTFTPGSSDQATQLVAIKLLKKGTAKTASAQGGNIVLDNSIDLTFPANAVVTTTGTAYSGNYQVSARYIDPSSANFFETMPGILTGLNEQNQLRALRSLGMATIELTDNSGNLLQIAPGKKVTIKLPATPDGPATVPLWHFNEKYGIWIQTGIATKMGSQYSAEVDHFSTYNLDLDFNSYKLTVQFKDDGGNNLAGLKVQVYTEDNFKIFNFYTDMQGQATFINCPESTPVIFKTVFDCDTLINQLAPLSADRSDIITLHPDLGKVNTYSISGKLTGCDDGALPNQPFELYLKSAGVIKGVPGVTDAEGNYNLTAMVCNAGTTATVQAISFIGTDYRYAPSATLTVGAGRYDARICDSTTTISDNFVVTFADQTLDSVVRLFLNKPAGAILYGEIKDIDSFSTGQAIIHSLAGMEYFTGLKSLDINYTETDDLSPLQNLRGLTDLSVISSDWNGFSDLSPLQNLDQLEFLTLSGNRISNLTPLRSLVKMINLGLNSTGITDISALSNMTELESFYLINAPVSDLSALRNMTKMNDLRITLSNVSDLSPLQGLSNMTQLELADNKIVDVSPLQNMTKMEILQLPGNQIADITPLQNMSGLNWLNLYDNKLTSVPSLNNLTKMTFLNLSYNLISDVSGIGNLPVLQTLDLISNKITDITSLTNGVPALQVFQISHQSTGTLSTAQKNAFKASHPDTFIDWD